MYKKSSTETFRKESELVGERKVRLTFPVVKIACFCKKKLYRYMYLSIEVTPKSRNYYVKMAKLCS